MEKYTMLTGTAKALECKTYSFHCSYRKSRVLLAFICGIIIFSVFEYNIQLDVNTELTREGETFQISKTVSYQSVSESLKVTTISTTKLWKNKYTNTSTYKQIINHSVTKIERKKKHAVTGNGAMAKKREKGTERNKIAYPFDIETKAKREKIKKIPFKEFEYKYPLAINMVSLVNQYRRTGKAPCKPINEYKYHAIKSPKNKCSEDKDKRGVFFIFLIKSAAANFERRKVIRNTWADEDHINSTNIKRVFLLGLPLNNRTVSESINSESEKYKDIVQINFYDEYYNNTLKTVGGINWVTKECSSAKFVLFVDDDFFVATDSLISYIKTIPKKQVRTLYMGFVNDRRPARRPIGDYAKWYIPYSEYPFTKYPTFVSAGAILMSMEFVKDVQVAVQFTKHFRFDDVFLGIVAYKLKVKPQENDDFWIVKCNYTDPCFDEMLVSHDYGDPDEVKIAWKLYLQQQTWG